MSKHTVAVRERELEEAGLRSLRAELAGTGAGAREQVMVDFLEDDLRAAGEAVEQLRGYVDVLGEALRSGRATRGELLAFARGEQPIHSLDELQATVTGLRRRLAVLAFRLPR